ncbi:MAG: hypothetical protein ACFFDQ_01035 [Candidatus Thorarchaeota archaeon]
MREDRASPKCAILSVFVGFLMIVLTLIQFIYDLLDGVVRFEVLRSFFGGVVMLILGLLIFRCYINRGAFDPISTYPFEHNHTRL